MFCFVCLFVFLNFLDCFFFFLAGTGEGVPVEPNPDVRLSQGDVDKMVYDEREFYADDRDQDRTRMSLLGGPATKGAR